MSENPWLLETLQPKSMFLHVWPKKPLKLDVTCPNLPQQERYVPPLCFFFSTEKTTWPWNHPDLETRRRFAHATFKLLNPNDGAWHHPRTAMNGLVRRVSRWKSTDDLSRGPASENTWGDGSNIIFKFWCSTGWLIGIPLIVIIPKYTANSII